MSQPAEGRGKSVFVHARGRVGVIFAAIISGLAFASADEFNPWRKAAVPRVMQSQNAAVQPLRNVPPPENALITGTKSPFAGKASAVALYHLPTEVAFSSGVPPDVADQSESADVSAPPIRIEHGHEGDAVDPILLAAWQAYRNNDLDAAMRHYSEVLDKDVQRRNSPNRDALLGMAAIAQQRSQDDIAARYYSQLLALDPRDPLAHAGMYSLLAASGAAGAESRLKLLLVHYPETAALHFALGNRFAEQLRWGDAQQAYFRACNLEPESGLFAFNLAVSLDHLGQGHLAARHYRRALQFDTASNASFDHAQTQLRLDELAPH